MGTWRAELRAFDESAEEWRESVTEWAFAYTLGGRAVQDVLIARDPEDPERLEGRGSTMRVYDSTLGAWRVSWFGAAEGAFCTLVATAHRRDGIRQDGTQTDGRPIRWNFSNITSDSFEWESWVSDDRGRTWWLEQHLDATRTG
ncbi:hypothetical protein O159_26780 [Leifsonia xyli subsp. cynodontis DSM 46306]|uniref:DUF1579 domain-containing protein n=1 Tax=Leifsonia xyli subsp. cynodontis DSM 46306 TaxID=1389489 RepID=U3PAM0_LEIXC|nr:hypothetical protein [Leifsonia xyli]AGW42584.1 hypothetical protein O159_26780 [Leifsonia xyli subsp. cynodontis DSM 46306]